MGGGGLSALPAGMTKLTMSGSAAGIAAAESRRQSRVVSDVKIQANLQNEPVDKKCAAENSSLSFVLLMEELA